MVFKLCDPVLYDGLDSLPAVVYLIIERSPPLVKLVCEFPIDFILVYLELIYYSHQVLQLLVNFSNLSLPHLLQMKN